MDPRFLKWMGEAMVLMAGNAEIMSRFAPGMEPPFAAMTSWWNDLMITAPFPAADAERFQREWLGFFGAVPKKDYDALERRAAALAAEVLALRQGVENMAAALGGMSELPEGFKPWAQAFSEAAGKQMEWYLELQQRFQQTAKDRSD